MGSIPVRVTNFPLYKFISVCYDGSASQRTVKSANTICSVYFPFGKQVGADYDEGPPVPIPNTEVKLISADNTCLETDREDRSTPARKVTPLGIS